MTQSQVLIVQHVPWEKPGRILDNLDDLNMSSTVVNVAIPAMSHQFTLGQERAQWVSSGFMVAMTVSMLTTPWLLARFGYRATFNGCMGLLLAGVHDLLAVAWFALIIAGASYARRWLANARALRVVDRVAGVTLVGFGVKLELPGH